MQCVILAGGKATRMRPLTNDIPKNLLPVCGKPFAWYQLHWLAKQGVREVVYSIGHLGEQIRAYVGDGTEFNLRVRYAEEKEALGTAGALRYCLDLDLLEPTFLATYGDSFLPIDLKPLIQAHQSLAPLATVAVFNNQGKFDRSNVKYLTKDKILYQHGTSDPSFQYIDYGISVLTREFLQRYVSKAEFIDMSKVYQAASENGDICGHEVFDRFYEIGSMDGYQGFEAYVKGGNQRFFEHRS